MQNTSHAAALTENQLTAVLTENQFPTLHENASTSKSTESDDDINYADLIAMPVLTPVEWQDVVDFFQEEEFQLTDANTAGKNNPSNIFFNLQMLCNVCTQLLQHTQSTINTA